MYNKKTERKALSNEKRTEKYKTENELAHKLRDKRCTRTTENPWI